MTRDVEPGEAVGLAHRSADALADVSVPAIAGEHDRMPRSPQRRKRTPARAGHGP